jgi:hypothetical protein
MELTCGQSGCILEVAQGQAQAQATRAARFLGRLSRPKGGHSEQSLRQSLYLGKPAPGLQVKVDVPRAVPHAAMMVAELGRLLGGWIRQTAEWRPCARPAGPRRRKMARPGLSSDISSNPSEFQGISGSKAEKCSER